MDRRLTLTYCDATGDYVVPYVLSPRDLVSRPDNMDKLYIHHMLNHGLVKLFDLSKVKI